MPNLYVGAYAASPTINKWSEEKEQEFIDQINLIPSIRGLELPHWGNGIHQYDNDFFYRNLNTQWHYTVTCLPGNMAGVKNNKCFGLASEDENGRKQAINFYTNVLEDIKKLHDRFNKKLVLSLQIASSPRIPIDDVSNSITAFEKSLIELDLLNTEGLNLLVEHCDSANNVNSSPVKGFMSLTDEIKSINNVNQSIKNKIGILINWGRSAIETRSAEGPYEHIQIAKEEGLLKGIIFSGTAKSSTEYGNWTDLHLPFEKTDNIKHYAKGSLLTLDEAKRCLSLVDPSTLDILGIKMLSMPMDTSRLDRRLGIINDSLKLINSIFL